MRKVKKLWRRHTHTHTWAFVNSASLLPFFIEAIWLELKTTPANIFAEILRRDLLNFKAANFSLLFSKFRSDLFFRVSFFFSKSLCVSFMYPFFVWFLREFGCRLSAGHHRDGRRQLRKKKKKFPSQWLNGFVLVLDYYESLEPTRGPVGILTIIICFSPPGGYTLDKNNNSKKKKKKRRWG